MNISVHISSVHLLLFATLQFYIEAQTIKWTVEPWSHGQWIPTHESRSIRSNLDHTLHAISDEWRPPFENFDKSTTDQYQHNSKIQQEISDTNSTRSVEITK